MRGTVLGRILVAAIPLVWGVGSADAATLEEIQAPPSLPSLETGPPSAVTPLPSLDSGPPASQTPLPSMDPGLPSLETPLSPPGSTAPLKTPLPPADPMVPPAPALPENVPVG